MTTSAVEPAAGERPDRPAGSKRGRRTDADRRRSRRWAVGAGLTAAVLTAVVAAPGLDNEFFRDEAVTADIADRSLGQVLDLVGTIDVGHALLYLLVSALPLDPTSVEQVRLVSLIPVMAAGAVIAAWATLALGRATGVLAALVWPLMPATVGVALYARDYGLATLFAVAASLLLIQRLAGRASSDDSRRPWWGYVAALVLMVWCNLFALLLLPAHGLAAYVLTRGNRSRFTRWTISAGAAMIGCAPLLVLVLRQPDPINWVAPPLLSDLVTIPNRILGGSAYGTNQAPAGATALSWAILALCVVAAAAHVGPWIRGRAGSDAARETEAGVLVEARVTTGVVTAVVASCWLVIPVVASVLVSLERPIFVARYLWFVAPAAVILLATLAAIPARAPASGEPSSHAQPTPSAGASRRGQARWAWALGVPLLVLVLGAAPRQGLLDTQGEVGYRATVAFLESATRPGDVIVSDDASYNFTRSGLDAAAGRALPVNDVLVARTGIEVGTIPAEEFDEDAWPELLADSDRIWVIARPGDTPGPREALAAEGRERIDEQRFGGLILRLYAQELAD